MGFFVCLFCFLVPCLGCLLTGSIGDFSLSNLRTLILSHSVFPVSTSSSQILCFFPVPLCNSEPKNLSLSIVIIKQSTKLKEIWKKSKYFTNCLPQMCFFIKFMICFAVVVFNRSPLKHHLSNSSGMESLRVKEFRARLCGNRHFLFQSKHCFKKGKAKSERGWLSKGLK